MLSLLAIEFPSLSVKRTDQRAKGSLNSMQQSSRRRRRFDDGDGDLTRKSGSDGEEDDLKDIKDCAGGS
ncbi:hypothetical protein QVD17_07139 [Tagetes erecta]|uniref:Uncharacterized protein n=1 Tax=Tagetes erecta TaxID=13708 RepID=A0AAD8LGX3_TARER|nr:hypothetical protein QVD17_07139 [Tagetes erecta]